MPEYKLDSVEVPPAHEVVKNPLADGPYLDDVRAEQEDNYRKARADIEKKRGKTTKNDKARASAAPQPPVSTTEANTLPRTPVNPKTEVTTTKGKDLPVPKKTSRRADLKTAINKEDSKKPTKAQTRGPSKAQVKKSTAKRTAKKS